MLLRCELLSFFSIFGIQNNEIRKSKWRKYVVNCFHFSVSLGYKTTNYDFRNKYNRLWIAFIFQYLWDTKQLEWVKNITKKSCELLSFFSIFGIQNNSWYLSLICALVVNCFHFSVSLGYKTTCKEIVSVESPLWIAFIFQYLWDTKQPSKLKSILPFSCELLSFFSIFGIQNNLLMILCQIQYVVNCFHFSVSLGYKTTTTFPWLIIF